MNTDELRGYQNCNSEWIRVLTHYVPELKLKVYSPQSVGEKLKELMQVKESTNTK